jgi:hypothetical protein
MKDIDYKLSKELFLYLKDKLSLPDTTQKAVITLEMDEVVRVSVDYLGYEKDD